MSLALVVTRAGLARFTAAQLGDAIDLAVAEVGLTDEPFVSASTLTALPRETRRLSTVSGEAVGDDVVHLVIRDDADAGYHVRGLGLYLADGTLFATYGQAAPIFEKSAATVMHLVVDVAFPAGTVQNLTFGDTNFVMPPATTARRGLIELATQGEVDAGDDTVRAVVPRTLAVRLGALAQTVSGWIATAIDALGTALRDELADGDAARVPLTRRIGTAGLVTGGGTMDGDIELRVSAASSEQMLAASADDVALTPASFDGNCLLEETGWIRHPGGLIEQWGVWNGSLASERTIAFAFPFPFPNACLGLTPVVRNPTSSGTGAVSLDEVSIGPAGASVFPQNEAGVSSAATGFRWRAWGY